MTTRRFLPALAIGLVMALAALFAAPQQAAAQVQDLQCCKYYVDIGGVPAACFPFNIKTQWGGGFTDIITYTANGSYSQLVPAPCPLAPVFDWASPDLGVTQVHLGETKVVWINGCCYKMTVSATSYGCITVSVKGC